VQRLSDDPRPIVLVGMRCAGKSTLGRALAAALGRPFVDLDDEVLRWAALSGRSAGSVAELLEREGEPTFRRLEAERLRMLLEPAPRIVLAAGGGVVERADARSLLARAARCFMLSVPVDVLRARMGPEEAARRPALLGGDPVAELGELLARREEWYRAVAHHVVDAAPPVDEVLAALLERLERTDGDSPS
jgi:shikimate kinase